MRKKKESHTVCQSVDIKLFFRSMHANDWRITRTNGIGTLREKTIHSVLKYYYAPNPAYHEIRIGTYVADICVDGEIFEIQTRNFNTMRDKLSFFSSES